MVTKLEKKELLLVPAAPQGKNNLSSRAAFLQAKLYHQTAFDKPKPFLFAEPLNFNYESLLYGRIDNKARSVILKEENAKEIGVSKDLSYNANFAVDAFIDFFKQWQRARSRGLVRKGQAFYDIEQVYGHVNPKDLYSSFMESQYDYFSEYLKEYKLINNIKNFSDFIKIFANFVSLKIPLISFTFSSFCISKFSSPRINGLIFELSSDSIVDDNNKYKKFINDPSYPLFFNLANSYGFSIDEKVPWRMIANIDSPQMKEYIKNYTDKENVYNNFYEKAAHLDFMFLKEMTISFYKKFIMSNPLYLEKKVYSCKNNKFNIKTEVKQKDNSYEFKDLDILRLQLYMKAQEFNLDWSQEKFEQMFTRISDMSLTLDNKVIGEYIEDLVNVKVDRTILNRNFSF